MFISHMKRQSYFIIFGIGLVLLLMYSPLGTTSKFYLTKFLAPTPKVLLAAERYEIQNYEWRLKDPNWQFFSFNQSEGKAVFVHFWASWHLPSKATLDGVQRFYDSYKDRIVFYIVTNEERMPVENFMKLNKYSFPVTYRVVGDPTPFKDISLGAAYLVSPKGEVLIASDRVANWDAESIFEQIDTLLEE